jgi:predicted Zn-dependent protease with MMP-like domain
MSSQASIPHLPLCSRLLLVALLALLPGCSVLRAPQTVVNTVIPKGGTAPPDPMALQIQLERFTDDFSMQMSQALDDYAQKVGTQSARVEILKLKLLSGSAMVSIASGPNPSASLLDMVAVATLSRMSVEDRWLKADKAPAYDKWLATSRALDNTAWQIATNELKESYVKELRETIERWAAQNPEALGTFFARPQEFASLVVHKKKATASLDSVFSMVNLDPTAGLDPAVREITQTRLLAERAMFALQRMPFLLRMQTELLTYEVTAQPEVTQALTNVTLIAGSADRISRATESVSQTAAQLPDRISMERKAILDSLDQQEGKLKDLAAQVDRTLESADKMSTSLNTTIGTFTVLMKLFGVGEPSTNAPPDTNSPPFNVLDYGQVADHVGAMAKDINTLVTTVDQSVPQLERLSQKSTADASKVVDHAFHMGLVLIAVLLTGAVLAGLVYRFFSEKLKRSGHSPALPRHELH